MKYEGKSMNGPSKISIVKQQFQLKWRLSRLLSSRANSKETQETDLTHLEAFRN